MDISTDDIIQITDEKHAWFPALLIVTEVKNWGVVAYSIILKSNNGSEPTAQAFNRLEFGEFEKVGIAAFVER